MITILNKKRKRQFSLADVAARRAESVKLFTVSPAAQRKAKLPYSPRNGSKSLQRDINAVDEEIMLRRKKQREYKRRRDARNRKPLLPFLKQQLPPSVRDAVKLAIGFPTVEQVLNERASRVPPGFERLRPPGKRPQPGEPGGPPADKAPYGRRCNAWLGKAGKWCGCLAMIGSDYCQRHTGREDAKNKTVRRVDQMPSVYSEAMKGTLLDAVNRLINEPKEDQFNFREELALCRHSAIEVVKKYNAAIEANDAKKALSVGMLMRETMAEIINLGDKVASIEARGKDIITLHDLNFIVNQLIGEVYNVLGETPEGMRWARAIEQGFRTNVRMPGSGSGDLDSTARVTHTSDEAFMGMIESVPTQQ